MTTYFFFFFLNYVNRKKDGPTFENNDRLRLPVALTLASHPLSPPSFRDNNNNFGQRSFKMEINLVHLFCTDYFVYPIEIVPFYILVQEKRREKIDFSNSFKANKIYTNVFDSLIYLF